MQSETWLVNEIFALPVDIWPVPFVCAGVTVNAITRRSVTRKYRIYFDGVWVATGTANYVSKYSWNDDAYRRITFLTSVTENFLTYLQSNGVKQNPVNRVEIGDAVVLDLTEDTVTPATLAKGKTAHDKSGAPIVGTMEAGSAKEEQEKTVNITANGTVEITPDAGKTLSKATAIVNVSTSGGGVTLNPSALYTEIVSKGTQVPLPTGTTGLYVETGQTYIGAWIAIKGENGTTAILYTPVNGKTSVYGYDEIALDAVALYSGPSIEDIWCIITEMDPDTAEVIASEAVTEVHYLLV